MSELSRCASSHFDWLCRLQVQLSSVGAAILEHDYLLLLMGSYGIVVGTAHRRLKFGWDGREFILDACECECQSQGDPPNWHRLEGAYLPPGGAITVEEPPLSRSLIIATTISMTGICHEPGGHRDVAEWRLGQVH